MTKPRSSTIQLSVAEIAELRAGAPYVHPRARCRMCGAERPEMARLLWDLWCSRTCSAKAYGVVQKPGDADVVRSEARALLSRAASVKSFWRRKSA